MGSNIYNGSKKELIIKSYDNGVKVDDIVNMGINRSYVMRTIQNHRFKFTTAKQPYLIDSGYRPHSIEGKQEPYFKNEMNYSKELNYNYEECKHEYNLEGKEPTIYGEIKDNEVKRFSGVVNTYPSN